MRVWSWWRLVLAGVLLTFALSACAPSLPFFSSGDAAGLEELLAQGQEALQKGDLEAAMEIYNEGVDRYPDDSHVYHQRALVHAQLGDIASALRDMDRSIERDPEDASHIFFRANIFLNIGNLQGALEDLTRLIELDPAFVEAYLARASIYYAQNRMDEALADMGTAIPAAPQRAGTLLPPRQPAFDAK